MVRLVLTLGWGATYAATLALACIVLGQLPRAHPPRSCARAHALSVCHRRARLRRVRCQRYPKARARHVAQPGAPRLAVSRALSAQIVFEVWVFMFTVWNALDRPRGRDESLTRALYRDGLLYFVVRRPRTRCIPLTLRSRSRVRTRAKMAVRALTRAALRIVNFVLYAASSPTPLIGAGSWCAPTHAHDRALKRAASSGRSV